MSLVRVREAQIGDMLINADDVVRVTDAGDGRCDVRMRDGANLTIYGSLSEVHLKMEAG